MTAPDEPVDFQPRVKKPKRPLSEKPTAVRSRMRKSAKNLNRDAEMLYKPIEEWDMEELAKGRPRNKSGTFTGPSPTWITPLIVKEARDRLKGAARSDLAMYAGDALKVMHKLMMDDSTDFESGKPIISPATRLQAATYILDQTIGKSTTPVEVTGNIQLESLMANVLVNPDGGLAHPVIEGEIAQEDDETEEDDDDDGGP